MDSLALIAPQTAPRAVQVSSENPPGVMSRLYLGMEAVFFGTPWGPMPNTRSTLWPLSTMSTRPSRAICLEGSGLLVVSTGSPSWGGNPLSGYGNFMNLPFSASSMK